MTGALAFSLNWVTEALVYVKGGAMLSRIHPDGGQRAGKRGRRRRRQQLNAPEQQPTSGHACHAPYAAPLPSPQAASSCRGWRWWACPRPTPASRVRSRGRRLRRQRGSSPSPVPLPPMPPAPDERLFTRGPAAPLPPPGLLVSRLSPMAAGSGIPHMRSWINGVDVPRCVAPMTLMVTRRGASGGGGVGGRAPCHERCRRRRPQLRGAPRRPRPTGAHTPRRRQVKSVGVTLAIASGLVAGKEGPYIQCGGILGYMTGCLGNAWARRCGALGQGSEARARRRRAWARQDSSGGPCGCAAC
jgi:hypothetical protein